MARWENITSKGKVVDRRGITSAVGGIGIAGFVFVLALNLLGGRDLEDALGILDQVPVTEQNTSEFEGEDEYEKFVSAVLGSSSDEWENKFKAINREYREPTLVLFRQYTESSCGGATSQVGPHYCPLDETIYLDETFFQELQSRFGAEGGDVAEAYVIAHEVGHHVQGVLDRLGQSRDPIQIELEADCLAGVWANSLENQNILMPGEIEEAMDAASAVGDDRIQERVSGYVNPETWTHGSSAQRVEAFTVGFNSGNLSSCIDNLLP